MLAAAGGMDWTVQRQETISLQGELDLARRETRELEQLRAEHKRLSEIQIPVEKLEALRADHAALPRLRAELEAMKKPQF